MKRFVLILGFILVPVSGVFAQCGFVYARSSAPRPTLIPTPGTYPIGQLVTISDPTPGAVIHYGSCPAALTVVSNSSFTVLSSTDVYISVTLPDGTGVDFVASYAIEATTPVFGPAPGLLAAGQTVTITAPGCGFYIPICDIYYTTDGTPPSSNSLSYSGPITVSNSETIQAIATGAGYVNSLVASASYSVTPLAPVQLLDPTPLALFDPTQSLMSGNSVTSDIGKLATLGRPVQGIAADGTAEIVLRIPVNNAKDTVTATVLNDECSTPSVPSTCSMSTNVSFDGGLMMLTDQQTPITVQTATGDTNKFAYLIYRAPDDFVRLNGPSNDPEVPTRPIEFQVVYKDSTGTQYAQHYATLTVVRPPVVLIHGYASDAVDTWQDFGSVSSQTIVYRVDYGYPFQVASTDPPIYYLFPCPLCVVTSIKRSDLGITFNTPTVAAQTIIRLRDFANGNNPAKVPISVSQADMVAHSMGGDIARYWSTNLSADTNGVPAYFLTPDNYNQGYIHKLITIGTPHFGSPFGTMGISPDASCFRAVSAQPIPSSTDPVSGLKTFIKPLRYEIGTAVLQGANGATVGGAVGELDGDGVGTRLSPTLNMIKASAKKLPIFTIAGDVTPGTPGWYMGVFALCFPLPDPVATRMATAGTYKELFDPNLTPATEWTTFTSTESDGAVPLTSALFGRPLNSTGTMIFNDAHGDGTQLLISAPRNLLDSTGDVLMLVQKLLNTSVDDTTQWVKQ